MKKAEINSEEIAKLAGVSRSTVSRVINNYTNVPPTTREKVLKVIQQYNYVPNASAQALKGKKTRTIGFFLIETGRGADDFLTNMLIARTIESASVRGYYVLTNIIVDRSDYDAIRGVKEAFFQKRIDGAVFIGAMNGESFIEELISEGYDIAVMDQNIPGRTESNRIVANFDSDEGMAMAIAHLLKLGHTDIGYIKGDMNWYSGAARFNGFIKSMQQHGVKINDDWLLRGGFNEQSGYLALQQLIRCGGPLPTAILASNDSAAFGAIKAIREAGLGVPENISVIGYDDHPLSSHYKPGLTTVRIDFKKLINDAVQALIDNIESDERSFKLLNIGSELVVRESSAHL